jgi:OmpA-OmpF porin, OOP family
LSFLGSGRHFADNKMVERLIGTDGIELASCPSALNFQRSIMKSLSLSTGAILALGIGLAAPAFAQSQPPTETWRMPYERGFWGHAGISFGQSKLDDLDCTSGACDDKDQAFKLYAGGRFSNIFGLEVGLLNIGKFAANGGEADGWGADAALIAGFPIGANSSIFGKLGVIYARTELSNTTGIDAGKERGFGGRWGVGGQLGLTKEWALRADYDRYRLPFPGDHRDLETMMIGVQYTFR